MPRYEDVDINQDGKVDFADYIRFAQAYGRNAEDAARFLPVYDWDGSDEEYFGDFVIFASHYGKSYDLGRPQLTVSGLSDTLFVGLPDTLYGTVQNRTLPRSCDSIDFKLNQVGLNSEIEF